MAKTAKKRTGERFQKGYRLATYPAALRMARLVDEMPRHGIGRRLQSVAESLSVDPQTVRRYVKALSQEFVTEAGEPQFVIEKKGNEEWLVRRGMVIEPSQATIYHLIAVYLALEYFRMLGKNVLAMSVEEVMERVERVLSPSHRALLRDLQRKFYNAPWAPKDYSGQEGILEDALKAIIYQNRIRIVYRKPGEEPWRYILEPLTLLYHKGGFYLVARSVRHQRPVYFNVERIHQLELTKEKFNYPKRYHPAQMLDGAFGIFTGPARSFQLRFAPNLAEYIASRKWHQSQKLRRQRDGSVILSLKVTDSEEVRSWIRSFGKQVKVIRPKGYGRKLG